jgi:hypothetical protein
MENLDKERNGVWGGGKGGGGKGGRAGCKFLINIANSVQSRSEVEACFGQEPESQKYHCANPVQSAAGFANPPPPPDSPIWELEEPDQQREQT